MAQLTRLGQYEIVARIGRGGMGDVYRAYERALDRTVAIKVLRVGLAQSEEFVRRFQAEAAAAAKLTHPNIVKIHFIGEDAGRHYIVMQLVEGESLAERLVRQGTLSVEETVPIAEQALAGLAAAHEQGMVHQDVKPGNILLDARNHQTLLTEFGLAKSLQSSVTGRTTAGAIPVTAGYVAPEQGRGLAVDGRSDLYSLGVVLYQMLSGRLPFQSDDLAEQVFQHVYEKPPPLASTAPQVPAALATIVERLLAKSPADRYQTADDVLSDLHAFRSACPLPGQSAPPRTIVRLPSFETDGPILPDGASDRAPPNWWERTRARAFSLFRRHAPEALQQLQNTQHQMDGAVAACERRQRDLQRLVQDAESILAELQKQARDQEAAALVAQQRVAAERDPLEAEQARDAQRACEDVAAELNRQVADQCEQSELIRLRLAQLEARKQELRNQRDILNARLQAAHARAQLESGGRRPPRRAAVTAAAGGGVALIVLISMWIHWRGNRESLPVSAAVGRPDNSDTALLKTEVRDKPLFETIGSGAAVVAVRSEGDGRLVIAARVDGSVEFLDTESGKLLKTLGTGADFSAGFAATRDGKVIVGATADGTGPSMSKLQIWTMGENDAGTIISELSSPIRPLAISDNQEDLLTLVNQRSSNQLVRWNLETRKERDRTSLPDGDLTAWAIHPDGSLAAFVRNRHEVIVSHTTANDEEATSFMIPFPGTAIAFHPKRRWLVVGGDEGTATVWDLDDIRPLAEFRVPGSAIRTLTFDSAGRRLAMGTDNDVRVWDLALDYVRTLCRVTDVRDTAFLPDGKGLVTGSRQNGVQVWNTEFKSLEVNFEKWLTELRGAREPGGTDPAIQSRLPIADAPGPTTSVTRDGRLRVRLWSEMKGHGPDGRMKPGGQPDKENIPQLEDTRTSETLLRYGDDSAMCITISRDGRFVATGGWDRENRMGDIRVWDARSGTELQKFIGHVHYCQSVAFSPDATRLLSGGENTMHLWDVATARELGRFRVPLVFVDRVSFSPDGRLGLASVNMQAAGVNHVLVDLESGEQLLQFHGPYPAIAWTPRDILCDTRFGVLNRLDAPQTGSSAASDTVPQHASQREAKTNSGDVGGSPPEPKVVAKPAARVVPQNVSFALQTARREFETRGVGTAEFRKALQSVAADLPEVQVSTGAAPAKWNTILLNAARTHIDAYRFRSPLGQTADMHWIFSLPDQVGNWYILPAQGAMPGFDSFERAADVDLTGAALPRGSAVIFQTLLGGRIQPGQEYILWHAPSENTPVELTLAIRLSPAGTHGTDRSVTAIARALGVEIKYPAYEQSPAGLRAALKAARDMARHGLQDTDGFRNALRSVRKRLPEISVSPESGELTWNRVSPDESFLFHAVRFKSSLAQPAHLDALLVAPFALPTWQILAAEGEMPGFGVTSLEVNLNLSGIALPEDNIAAFQSLPDGSIEPDREYILWFMPSAGAVPDMDLAIRLSRAGPPPEADTARSTARAMGLSLPEIPSPERVTAAFRRCRRLFDRKQQTTYEFQRLIAYVLPALPALNVGTERAEWNHLNLATTQVPFCAYRLASPVAEPAALYSVFAKPSTPKSAWWFSTLNPYRSYNPNRFAENDVRFDDVNLPERNVCVFESIPGGYFQTDDPVVVCFAPETPTELTVHVALRMIAAGENPVPASPTAAAAILGLNLRPPPAPAGSRLLEGHTDAVSGVAYSADGKQLATASSDGTVRMWDAATGKSLKTVKCSITGVASLSLSDDATRLATCNSDRKHVIVLDMTTSETIATVSIPGQVDSFAVSADGRWLAVCDSGMQGDGQVRTSIVALRNLETAEHSELIRSDDVAYRSVRWSPESGTLIVAGTRIDPAGDLGRERCGLIQIIERTSAKVLREFSDDMWAWSDVALSPDGRRLAGAKVGSLLRVWDLPSGKEIASVAQDAPNPKLALSSDGRLIATASDDGTVRIWDGETLRMRRILRGHAREVYAVAFAPDGQTLASVGRDGSVRIWDVKNPDPRGDADEHLEPLANSVGMKMMPIPSGEFLMGTPASFELPKGYVRNIESERPQHRVRITRPYYLAAHEVTVEQFRKFVDATGHRTTAETSGFGGAHMFDAGKGFENRPELHWKNPGLEQGDNHPVVQVSWSDAVAFCEWLSGEEGVRYRLPTEAEWEYACRAGSTTTWSFGDYHYYLKWCGNAADRGMREHYGNYQVAEFSSDGFTFTSPVGAYLPNAYGLFDMHGNAFEWCADWSVSTYYSFSEPDDPQGPKAGEGRVQRSASFMYHGVDTRSSYRSGGPPDQTSSQLGFRVVREIP